MGYAVVMGHCFVCKKAFTFNPHKVPSTSLSGHREPICRSCIEVVNAKRRELGNPEWPVPAGAYDPIDEHEL